MIKRTSSPKKKPKKQKTTVVQRKKHPFSCSKGRHFYWSHPSWHYCVSNKPARLTDHPQRLSNLVSAAAGQQPNHPRQDAAAVCCASLLSNARLQTRVTGRLARRLRQHDSMEKRLWKLPGKIYRNNTCMKSFLRRHDETLYSTPKLRVGGNFACWKCFLCFTITRHLLPAAQALTTHKLATAESV